MINITTTWLRSLGLLPTPLTPQQRMQQKFLVLAWKIRAVQMCELHQETGYLAPEEIRRVWQ